MIFYLQWLLCNTLSFGLVQHEECVMVSPNSQTLEAYEHVTLMCHTVGLSNDLVSSMHLITYITRKSGIGREEDPWAMM